MTPAYEHLNPKLNLGNTLELSYGSHRSGWSYALKGLEQLHSEQGIQFEPFIEKKFVFGGSEGDAGNNFTPIEQPWVGFMHVPPGVPKWFHYLISPDYLLETEERKRSER